MMHEKETQELLEILGDHIDYDPSTGLIKWKQTRSGRTAKGWFSGCPDGDGYRIVMLFGKYHRIHRLAWAVYYGKWPNGEIDHDNGVKSDNRIENLKLTTHQWNARNMKLKKNSTSGVTGVCFCVRRSKWKAYIRVDGNMKNLGEFVEFNDAVSARKAAEVKYGFHPNHGSKR